MLRRNSLPFGSPMDADEKNQEDDIRKKKIKKKMSCTNWYEILKTKSKSSRNGMCNR